MDNFDELEQQLETTDDDFVFTNEDLDVKKLFIRKQLIDNVVKQETDLFKPRSETKDIIFSFLKWELVFFSIFVLFVLSVHGFFSIFTEAEFFKLIDVMMFFTTTIIAEFIAMIFFIVKYLFNTRLVDVLEKWFKEI